MLFTENYILELLVWKNSCSAGWVLHFIQFSFQLWKQKVNVYFAHWTFWRYYTPVNKYFLHFEFLRTETATILTISLSAGTTSLILLHKEKVFQLKKLLQPIVQGSGTFLIQRAHFPKSTTFSKWRATIVHFYPLVVS